jgi:acyl-[acyl-carrier-protein] desaturase
MSSLLSPDNPDLKKRLYPLFRDFFARAERKRRWSIEDDIPWEKTGPELGPVVATIVESFCAVELYLPDYVAKALPMIRTNRGWAWFHVTWGYEEAKHSMALGDWLLRSGLRTEEQLADMEDRLFAHEWDLPEDSASGMLIYAMVQELATWLHYRNLRQHIKEGDDPALYRLLELVSIDERAHYSYYRHIVGIFLELDRATTLEQLRRVLGSFSLPAVHLLADSRQRIADVKAMNIFNDEIFFRDVYTTLLETLGISRVEMRQRVPSRKSQVVQTPG